jgi:hypothetical protein
MIFEKKTKWIPLVAYNAGGTDYMVMARKGLRTGMIRFKTKRVTPIATCSYNFSTSLLDINKTFSELNSHEYK